MEADISGVLGDVSGIDTFLGLPKGDPSRPGLVEGGADVAIIGAPCATPYESTGLYAAGAPAAIRRASATYAAARGHMDFDLGGPAIADDARIVDCGDVTYLAGDKAGNRAAIETAVRAVLEAEAVPIVLGGDDSIPTPVLAAYAGRGPLTVLQIDAHIDWRDEVGGERWGLSSTMRRASERPEVAGMIQVGARAVGSARPTDFADAKDWGVKFVTAADLHDRGVSAVIDLIPEGADLFIDFDIDGLDPSVAPGVIGPAPGGLFMHQALAILRGAAAKARIAGFCLVEFAPDLDRTPQSANVAYRLAAVAAGLAAPR